MNTTPKTTLPLILAAILSGCVAMAPQESRVKPQVKHAFWKEPAGTPAATPATHVQETLDPMLSAPPQAPFWQEVTKAVLVGCISSGNCW